MKKTIFVPIIFAVALANMITGCSSSVNESSSVEAIATSSTSAASTKVEEKQNMDMKDVIGSSLTDTVKILEQITGKNIGELETSIIFEDTVNTRYRAAFPPLTCDIFGAGVCRDFHQQFHIRIQIRLY